MKCFYCDKEVKESWEFQRDHFPVPRRAGGRDVVVACLKCHDDKDRAGLSGLKECIKTEMDSGKNLAYLQAEFLAAFEDGVPEVARRTLMRLWPAFPPRLRTINARILADLY